MHYTLTVVVPSAEAERLNDYLDKVLAPFEVPEDAPVSSTAKYDYWSIGGHKRGWFLVKPNMPYVLGDGAYEERPEDHPQIGFGDVVRYGDVDWDGLAEHLHQRAARDWGADGSARTLDEYLWENPPVYATYALLTKDGDWLERGAMPRLTWAEKWIHYVNTCDWDDVLVNVDYHI